MNGADGKAAWVLENSAVADAEICFFAADRPLGAPALSGPGPLPLLPYFDTFVNGTFLLFSFYFFCLYFST